MAITLAEAKVDKDLIDLGLFSFDDLMTLSKHGVKKLDDLADLSTDELIEILPSLSAEEAGEIIVKSREHWFK